MRTRARAKALAYQIKELHENEGMSVAEIARYLGMSWAAVASYADGISGSPKPRSDIDAQEVLRLASEGYSTYAICKAIGCSRHAVMTILAEQSVKPTARNTGRETHK